MKRLPSPVRILVGLVVIMLLPGTIQGQSLRGSPASVDRMYDHAVDNGIYFYKTGDGIKRAAEEGRLVRLGGNADYTTHAVSYPYVKKETQLFVHRLASQYRNACGEQLVVTSAARPQSMRLFNSVRKSVHPTGIAIDLRRPRNSKCLAWLRRTLLSLERSGVIEATEERNPPHFHVAVFPNPYARYVAARGGPTLASAEQYEVRRGDSLWGIARRHETTVDALMAANGLSSSRIVAGQKLRLP